MSVILWAVLACLGLTGCEYGSTGGTLKPPVGSASFGTELERIKGVVFDARRAPGDSVLLAISEVGTSHLALVTFGFQEGADDPQLRFSPDARWYSESDEGARALARRADELGMGIILKPQIWLGRGAWSADIDFDSEQQWSVWENAYRKYLMHTARLADEVGADLLIIGTELSNAVREREGFWRSLIAEIRTVYDGPLTYGANWHDDYVHVGFWDALDFIGVQAYFPLSSRRNPDLEAIKAGWIDPLEELQALAVREGRPILFTEVGYRSVPYAAEEPWRWPSRDERIDPDYRLQADLYRGFFESLWDRSWFGGAILWKFYPESGRRGHELDFTPQGKPAEQVVRAWFSNAAD